jgi:uncharacterized membrane protein
MKNEYAEGVTSTAAIAGHPIHPMLVPFPIAFLVGALVTDLVFLGTGGGFWARASFWLLIAGVVTGLVAALFGLIDFVTIRRARAHSAGWIHFLGNLVAVVLAGVSVLLRRGGNQEEAIMPLGLVLSVVVSLILLVTGWLGGELAYRYKIGVVGRGREMEAREMPGGTRQRPA